MQCEVRKCAAGIAELGHMEKRKVITLNLPTEIKAQPLWPWEGWS